MNAYTGERQQSIVEQTGIFSSFLSFFSYFVRDVISPEFVRALYVKITDVEAISCGYYFSRLLLNRFIDYTLDVVLISRTRASQAPVNNPYTLYMALAVRILYNIIIHRYSILSSTVDVACSQSNSL